jgi:hypothetical protein
MVCICGNPGLEIAATVSRPTRMAKRVPASLAGRACAAVANLRNGNVDVRSPRAILERRALEQGDDSMGGQVVISLSERSFDDPSGVHAPCFVIGTMRLRRFRSARVRSI